MDSVFPKLSKPVCPIDGFSFQQSLAVSNEERALNPHISDFVTQELTANLQKQIDEIEARKEEMLRQFFRTEENARQWGRLFVIEEKPPELIPRKMNRGGTRQSIDSSKNGDCVCGRQKNCSDHTPICLCVRTNPSTREPPETSNILFS